MRISRFIPNWLLHKHDSSSLLGILQHGVGSNRACCGHCTLSITCLFFYFDLVPAVLLDCQREIRSNKVYVAWNTERGFPSFCVYFRAMTQTWSIVSDRQFFRLCCALAISTTQNYSFKIRIVSGGLKILYGRIKIRYLLTLIFFSWNVSDIFR